MPSMYSNIYTHCLKSETGCRKVYVVAKPVTTKNTVLVIGKMLSLERAGFLAFGSGAMPRKLLSSSSTEVADVAVTLSGCLV